MSRWPKTIAETLGVLASGELTSSQLVAESLQKIQRSTSVIVSFDAESVGQQAAAVDRKRAGGETLPPYAGIPITLKDLFDVRGEVTAAGSRILASRPPAEKDAPVVKALRESGFIFLGRTNMSEFAFSGIGVNPHHGTPLSIWDRQTKRLPGGSSSGGAVSIAEGIVCGSIGSDTAGSTRVPAAFNGIVGYKPSYGRYPLEGVYPLSPTLDAAGPMAASVDCCYRLARAMDTDKEQAKPQALTVGSPGAVNLLVPQAEVMNGLDEQVSAVFAQALERLQAAGCKIETRTLPVLDDLFELFRTCPFAGYEAWLHHRDQLQVHAEAYDPFVRWRIEAGADMSDEVYKDALIQRQQLIQQFNSAVQEYDAVVFPTVVSIPPRLDEVTNPEAARSVNFNCLRNTAMVNYFDGCAITIPCHVRGEAPVGLMLSACHGQDEPLFQLAAMAEGVLF